MVLSLLLLAIQAGLGKSPGLSWPPEGKSIRQRWSWTEAEDGLRRDLSGTWFANPRSIPSTLFGGAPSELKVARAEAKAQNAVGPGYGPKDAAAAAFDVGDDCAVVVVVAVAVAVAADDDDVLAAADLAPDAALSGAAVGEQQWLCPQNIAEGLWRCQRNSIDCRHNRLTATIRSSTLSSNFVRSWISSTGSSAAIYPGWKKHGDR